MTTKPEANPKPAVTIIIDYSQFHPDRADVVMKINDAQVRTHLSLKLLECLTTETGILREYPDTEIIDYINPDDEDPTAEIHPCLIDDASENPRAAIHREINASMPKNPRQVEKPAPRQPDPYNDAIIEKMVHNNSTLA